MKENRVGMIWPAHLRRAALAFGLGAAAVLGPNACTNDDPHYNPALLQPCESPDWAALKRALKGVDYGPVLGLENGAKIRTSTRITPTSDPWAVVHTPNNQTCFFLPITKPTPVDNTRYTHDLDGRWFPIENFDLIFAGFMPKETPNSTTSWVNGQRATCFAFDPPPPEDKKFPGYNNCVLPTVK